MEEIVTEEIAARVFAAAWNTMDPYRLEPYLADDVTYESQMVITPHKGKTAVMDYTIDKMELIKSAGEEARVYAELGRVMGSKPCVVLAQGSPTDLEATVLFQVKENRIFRIDICLIPHPTEAVRSGIYPT